MICQVNGYLQDQLPVPLRGLYYGDGLFETMRCEAGDIALKNLHLQRLVTDAARLGIALQSDAAEEELEHFLQAIDHNGQADGVVRFTLVRGGERRGYLPEAEAESWRILQYFPGLPPWGADIVKTVVAETRLADQPALAGVKHLNRLEQVLAGRELARFGADNGLLLDYRDCLVCGLDANVWLQLDDNLVVTPNLQNSGVAGVFRRYMMEQLLPRAGVQLELRRLTLGDVATSRGLWLSNAVRGLCRVQSVQSVADWPECDPLLPRLQGLASEDLNTRRL